jgi:hypothetical protein
MKAQTVIEPLQAAAGRTVNPAHSQNALVAMPFRSNRLRGVRLTPHQETTKHGFLIGRALGTGTLIALATLSLSCDNANYPPRLPLDPQYTNCARDDQCIQIQLGCCEDCQGGLAVIVHRDQPQKSSLASPNLAF